MQVFSWNEASSMHIADFLSSALKDLSQNLLTSTASRVKILTYVAWFFVDEGYTCLSQRMVHVATSYPFAL